MNKNKIISTYDRIAAWLCGWGADRWVHLLFGLLISFNVSWALFVNTVETTKLMCAFCGALIAILVGLAKEITDIFLDKPFDSMDALFTLVGGIIGALFYMM